ncbi:hypothetical protein DV735_g146, partial [Chaetothyriales sp. CBS 134920]
MSVTLHTTHGDLKVEVLCESVPKTAENFLALCASGAYNETPFHRLIPDFMVQGGDTSLSPLNTADSPIPKGGTSIWREYFEDEIKVPALRHNARGVVSMANKGPSTNGSQFFITLKEAPHLDGKNTVFGRVIDGAEEGGTLERIEAVAVDKKYRPKGETILLQKVTIHANPLAGDQPPTMSTVTYAQVRIVGRPNANFLVGYPGISATLPRIEGTVELRPLHGVSSPVKITLVTISLQRRESIHPNADSVAKKHLAAPRKESTETVGKEMLLYRCHAKQAHEEIMYMDLPFVIFIPFGRGGQETARRVPPASLQLPKRTAETFYELVVTVGYGDGVQKKYAHLVPITRYDTLSTFGMYNRPESAERVADHLVTLGISLPRWSYGPLDPVSVYVKLSPNPDWLNKAKKVTVKRIEVGIDEEVIYNHEGDEPQRKTKTLARKVETVGIKLPEPGYITNVVLVFPSHDLRDQDGILPRSRAAFPNYAVTGFTTTAGLYKVEYYLTVKASLNGAKDILLKQPIVACPLDHAACKAEMEAIEQAARDAAHVNSDNPLLPLATIIKARDADALRCLGIAMVAGVKKPLIE